MMKPKSFAERIQAQRNRMYYLRFMPADGRSAYYFVLVDPPKEKSFLKALKGTEVFNLEEYGTIVKSGYGDPSPELKKEMKEKYNITYGDE